MGEVEEEEELWLIRFASLLHDIGKFWQGTCKRGEHEELSANFLRQYFPNLEGLSFVAGHHNASQYTGEGYKLLKILVASDWLSAGEREEREEKESRKETPLLSIFSEIKIDEGKAEEKYILPASYSLDYTCYPKKKEDIRNIVSSYKALWDTFCDEIKKLNKKRREALFTSLYYLLQKYTSFIPSAVYTSKPDISLFDHSKMTCAIADCIYRTADIDYLNTLISALQKSFKEKESELNSKEKEVLENNKFLLIGGDISGIQKFIYTIISKKAAKGLKGRSFYLELLGEIMAYYILEKLNLTITNLIYCAGGHFYILAYEDVDIEELRKDISKKLFDLHRGKLYLAIEAVKIAPKDFKPGEFPKKLEELSNLLRERKKRKFEEIINEINLFEPVEAIDICQICGEPITSDKDKTISKEEEEEIIKCKLCDYFEKLADEIKKNYIIIENVTQEGAEEFNPFAKFGYRLIFDNSPRNYENAKFIYKINSTEFVENIIPPIGYKFYLKTPAKELKELAEKEKATGLQRWGIIRGDVDNLGLIFSKGLGKNATISRISTLSSMLSFFFKGWMNKICQQYERKIYGIYSGGDDFFIIGSWDVLPELAKKIQEEFTKFTCENPSITLSIGTYIAPSIKYPIYRAADLAGEELDGKAKKREGKNSIAFLGKAIKWDKFKEVEELKNDLLKKLKNGVSKGFLYKLYSIYEEYRKALKEKGKETAKYDGRYSRWRWLLAYILAREKGIKDKEEFKARVKKNIDYLDVAVRWCEYLEREVVKSE